MANQTRAWPIWKTRMDEIMPSMAPMMMQPRPVQRGAGVLEIDLLERVDHRRSIVHQRAPMDQAGEHDRDSDVEDGADDQRGDDADGHIALRILALLGRGGDGVESDVGEEDDGAAGEESRPAIGIERIPVRRMDDSARRPR